MRKLNTQALKQQRVESHAEQERHPPLPPPPPPPAAALAAQATPVTSPPYSDLAAPQEVVQAKIVAPEQSAPPGAGAPPPPEAPKQRVFRADFDPNDIAEDFDGYLEMIQYALRHQGNVSRMDIIVKLAQADAMNRIAHELHTFNKHMGAFDEDDESNEAPMRISDMISEGILNAMVTMSEDEDFMKGILENITGAGGKKKKKSAES